MCGCRQPLASLGSVGLFLCKDLCEFVGTVPKAKSSTLLPQSFVTTGNPEERRRQLDARGTRPAQANAADELLETEERPESIRPETPRSRIDDRDLGTLPPEPRSFPPRVRTDAPWTPRSRGPVLMSIGGGRQEPAVRRCFFVILAEPIIGSFSRTDRSGEHVCDGHHQVPPGSARPHSVQLPPSNQLEIDD